MTEKVAFLVDGFNVYHSVLTCLKKNDIKRGKWFDYRSYFEHLLTNNSQFKKNSTISQIKLYTALANHLGKPGVVQRHKTLNAAMNATGVEVILGSFSRKQIKCGADCGISFFKYEEKKTDTNVAIGILEALITDQADCAIVVSGDTDHVPALEAAKRLFPQKRIGVLMPAYRHNNELKKAADFSLMIKPSHYETFLLPERIQTTFGEIIKPTDW